MTKNKIANNPTAAKLRDDLHGLESFLSLCKVTGLGRVMGIDIREQEKQLRSVKAEYDKIANAPDRFNEHMGACGWIAYESLNAELMNSCVELAQAGKADDAEKLLIDYYSERKNTEWQMWRLQQIEVFAKRYEILSIAYEDYMTGKYYTCVPLFLMQMDGAFNELKKTNKGLFAAGADLTAWDSIAGHPTGLGALISILYATRKKVTTEEIHLPYRNGILHGKDLGYGNIYVASKSLAALFAVADLARAVLSEKNRQDVAASKNKSWKELREIQEQTRKTKIAIDKWEPRVIDGANVVMVDGTPEYAVNVFFQNYMAKRHALTIAQIYQPAGSIKSTGVLINRFKTALEENTVLGYSITSIEDEAPVISNIFVDVEVQASEQPKITKNVKCRLIYGTENGTPLVRGQEGRYWYLVENVLWDLCNIVIV